MIYRSDISFAQHTLLILFARGFMVASVLVVPYSYAPLISHLRYTFSLHPTRPQRK